MDIDEEDVYLHASYIPVTARYHIKFSEGKASLFNIAAETYIGYSASSLTNSNKQWNVRELHIPSLVLYSVENADGSLKGIVQSPDATDTFGDFIDVFALLTRTFTEESENLYLFNVAQMPKTEATPLYTTDPFAHNDLPLLDTGSTSDSLNKIIKDGRLLIIKDGRTFNALGMPLK